MPRATGRRVAVVLCIVSIGASAAVGAQPLTRVGAEFGVNIQAVGVQQRSSIDIDAAGRFVVVWEGQDGSGYGIIGQRFDSSGGRQNFEFQVGTYTLGTQRSA